jgi:hypothetical protein
MASNINTTNLDTTYPIAGQDNDTQGFRTNFTNIQNNFVVAYNEITALQGNVSTLQTNALSSNAPATNSSTGTAGQMAYDGTHLYVCVATNTWVRTTLSTF